MNMSFTTIHTSTIETPASKNQDMVLTGKLPNGNIWYIVADGHGNNTVIDKLRSLNYLEIMLNGKPVDIIYEEINKITNTFNSGATISLVMISSTTISMYWRGDSTIKVWADNVQVFESENHDDSNAGEVERMNNMGIRKIESWAPKVLSGDTLTMVRKNYFVVGRDNNTGALDKLNMTNCVGHNNCALGNTDEHHIEMIVGVDYKVVAASDGLWDIVAPDDSINEYSSSTSLSDFAIMRWGQEWNYAFPGHPTVKNRLDSRDDIGVAMWVGGIF